MNTERCQNCRYSFLYGWRDALEIVQIHQVHQCRRRSPIIVEKGSSWPEVIGQDWCGDWEQKVEEPI